MSGNGKTGIMRPASRSPPFVVVGLLVLMCALGYKYWSLLGQHGDLSAQWEKAQSELRVVYEKQITAEKKSTDLTGELTQEKQNVDNLKKTVGERDKKVAEQQQQIEQLNKEATTIKESMAKCDKEKGDLQTEKEKLAQENNNLKQEVEKARATPCDRNACKEPIREVVGELNKIIGQPTVMQALSKASFDLKPILGDMMESAGNQNPADGGKGQQQQQQPPQVVAQRANNIQMQLAAVGRVPQRGGLLEQGGGEPGGGDNLKMGSEEHLQGQRVQDEEMNFNQIEDRKVQVIHQDRGKPEAPQVGVLQMDVNEELVEEENGKQEQLPEDEMDKQAAAIQAAQESAAARDGNVGDSNLKAHFQDLNQNGASNQEVNNEVELSQQRMDDFNKQELKRWNAEGKKNDHLDLI